MILCKLEFQNARSKSTSSLVLEVVGRENIGLDSLT